LESYWGMEQEMIIVYHPDYQKVYASTPAARAGSMEAILKELKGYHDSLGLEPASASDLRRIHSF